MNNGRSNNIVSQCKRALNSGASFKDFADYTLGMGSVDSLIPNVNHLRATDMWPADYVIPGDKFALADFRKFRYALSSDVKFSVPKENIRYWGCVSGHSASCGIFFGHSLNRRPVELTISRSKFVCFFLTLAQKVLSRTVMQSSQIFHFQVEGSWTIIFP